MVVTCFVGSVSGLEVGNMNGFNLEVANKCGRAWPRTFGSDVGRHPVSWQQPEMWPADVVIGLTQSFFFFLSTLKRVGVGRIPYQFH